MRIAPLEGNSQAEDRKYVYIKDQHGRKFGAWTENKTGDPCGPVMPSFQAPLNIDPKYMRLSKDEWNHTAVTIDYDAWIHDFRAIDAEHMKRVQNMMAERHQAKYIATMEPDDDIKFRVGRRPSIQGNIVSGTVVPLVAAKAGNPWILGITDVVDTRLEKYFVKPKIEGEDEDWSQLPVEFATAGGDPSLDDEYDAEALGGKTVPTPANIRKRGGPAKQSEASL